MIRIIDQGIKTGKDLGYSRTFPETAKVKYRQYLVGSGLEGVSFPVNSDHSIEKFIATYFPNDQVEI
jgi:hypothetical protein